MGSRTGVIKRLVCVYENPFLERNCTSIPFYLRLLHFFKRIIQNCSISKLNEGYYQIEPKLAEARASLICRLGQT